MEEGGRSRSQVLIFFFQQISVPFLGSFNFGLFHMATLSEKKKKLLSEPLFLVFNC